MQQVSGLAEQKQLSRAGVRRTIAASLATAFGLVIALIWSNVVLGGLKTFGVNLDVTPTLYGWLYFVVIAVVLTIVMVTLIVVVSRWGGKEK
jgi:uncharacterized protein YacL